MLLFEKINTLEALFTTAKTDLATLEQTIQDSMRSFVEAQVEQAKLEAQGKLTKALEHSQASLEQTSQAHIQELFSSKFEQLAQTLSQSLDLQNLSAQIAQSFANQNSLQLQQALEQALKQSEIGAQLERLKAQAEKLIGEFEATLKKQLESTETSAQESLQTLLEQNATKLLERLDLEPLRESLETQIAPHIDAAQIAKKLEQKLEQETRESVQKQLEKLIQKLHTDELAKELAQKATQLAHESLASDEIVKLRYECALRLQAIKCYATEEIVSELIAQSAKRQNYEDIIAEALRSDKKVYLSV